LWNRCSGTVACAPFTLQGSQVRNLYCPPQSKILKTINTLGSFQDFISKIYAYASLGSIFFDSKIQFTLGVNRILLQLF
jgi:hypothetical protein